MALSNRYSGLECRDLYLNEYDSTSTPRNTAYENSYKNLKDIQRLDLK